MLKLKPHSRRLRANREMEAAECFFVTKALQPRKKIITPQMAEIISGAWKHYAEIGKIDLAAFVVMPDHWHLLFGPREGGTLPGVMQSAGSWIGRHTNKEIKNLGCRWQDGYYDTRIRSGRQFIFVKHYIEENPVRAGLAEKTEHWEWSSANPKYSGIITFPWPGIFQKDGED